MEQQERQAIIDKIDGLFQSLDIAIEIAEKRALDGNYEGAQRAIARARELELEIAGLIARLPIELDSGSDG